MLNIDQKFLMSQHSGFILKTISSAMKSSIQSALEVNKTCVPPLTYALLLSSVPLSGEVHSLNEMATQFMKHPIYI